MRRLAILLLLGVCAEASAEPVRPSSRPVAEREVTLDEIVVTGEPEEEGANLRTLRREAIERRPAQTAVELLERDPSILGTTGRRGERIFTLRGFDQRQVAILIDGAPAYLPYDGQVDLGLLPAELIDHLTVIKGPASVLYGANGLGGAINLVTRRPGVGPLLGATAEYGRAGSLQLGGVHSARVGRLGYTVYGGIRRRDAFALPASFEAQTRENGALRENSDSLQVHVGGNLELQLPRGQLLSAGVQVVDGDRGIPPGIKDPTVRYWRMSTWRSVGTTLGHRARFQGGRLELDELAYLRLYDNLLDSYDDASYSTQSSPRAFHSWYHDVMLGGRVRARYRLDRTPWGRTQLRMLLGAEHDRHDEEPENELVTRSLITAAPEAEAFLGERWSLVAGLQLDLEVPGRASASSSSSRFGIGPLLSLRFDPRDDLWLRATVARRSRFPTLRERFTSGLGDRTPNPDLTPETAWHFGVEASWQPRRWLSLQASVQDAEVEDLIELVSLGGGAEQFQNIPGARLLGAELSLEVSPWRWLALKGSYAFLHARRSEPLDQGLELSYRPEHKGALELSLAPARRWIEWSTTLRLMSARPFQHPASGAWQRLDTAVTWDMGLALRPTRWLQVWVRAANLLDSRIESEYGYPDPGRELWVGMRLRYDRPGSAAAPR